MTRKVVCAYIHIVGNVPGGSASARPYSATDAQRSSMAAPTDLYNVICARKQQSVHTAQRLMPEAGAYSAAPHARGRRIQRSASCPRPAEV